MTTPLYDHSGVTITSSPDEAEGACIMVGCSRPASETLVMDDRNQRGVRSSWPVCAEHAPEAVRVLVMLQAVPVGGLDAFPVGLS